MSLSTYRAQWSHNPVREVLAGMVGTFALIPEVIAFSYVAGVSPALSLGATFVLSVVIALTGGRPGMISGAAGSVALVAGSLVHRYGVDYLIYATILAGLLQLFFGALRLHVLMRFVSSEVRTGFVNALGIMIFIAQLPQVLGRSWQTEALILCGLLIIYLCPFVTKAIPSPLICVVVLTAFTIVHPLPVSVIADLGALPNGLPQLTLPTTPLSLSLIEHVLPYALAMAAVGLLESLMTAGVTDDLTDTHANPRMECVGLGLSNMCVGFFGGIAGCGMVGQTVGNLRYGGRGRLSTLTAGAFLLICMILLRHYIARVPVAALVAIMIMVSVSTFAWDSLRDLYRHPKLANVVMVLTVITTVATRDLAIGVGVGVLLNGIFFAWSAKDMLHIESHTRGATDHYTCVGQVFFGSADLLYDAIDFQTSAADIVLDVRNAKFWDITAVEMLEKIIAKLKRLGHDVNVTGLAPQKHDLIAEQANEPLLSLPSQR